MIIIGGVIVTALISLNQVFAGNLNDPIFWITWCFSISTTIASKVLYSYSFDKKYLIARDFMVRLQAEGWQYIHGIGTYEALDAESRFTVFVSRIEDLHKRSTENASMLDFNDTIEIVGTDDRPPMRSRIGASSIASTLTSLSSFVLTHSPAHEDNTCIDA
jgi:hypothetical protein